ncbi:MAG: ABC transporter ATP-binding protein [Opitutales bacterium]
MNEALIVAKGLKKSFLSTDEPISVLDGVDFTLSKGESVSIRGESGSGKSTLLNVLSGLETADSGQLYWSGREVSGLSLASLAVERASCIGFVFQSYYLAPELNSLENVLLAARIRGRIDSRVKERAVSLLDKVGMGHRLRHSSTKLSGGERQRVAVARALINDPAVLLADEPTGNLDEATAEAVMELLLQMTSEEGKSLVLVTHNPEFASRTRVQLSLHFGKLETKNRV